MSISNYIRQQMIEGSAIRKMFEEGDLLKKKHGADKVFDLTIGNPEMEPPPAFDKALKNLVNNPIPGMHRYMATAGYPETRAAVAKQLSKDIKINFTVNDIVMTCGAAGGINATLKAILNPQEEVIIFAPYFVEFPYYIDNHGGVIKVVPTDENFLPKLDLLEKAITSKTKAVIINSPNNPTGAVYSEELIHQIGELLNRKEEQFNTQIYLISDEAYRKIIFDGIKYQPVFHHSLRSIVIYSHSKDLALPGERIGYIAIHPDCPDHDDLMSGLIFSNRVLGFVNAPALMQNAIRELQDVTVSIDIYQKKRDFLYSSLTNMGYKLFRPQGAFYMFPKCPIDDDVTFVKELQEFNVLTVPGSSFGTPGYIRIVYCIEDKTIEGSLDGFRKVAQKYHLY
jgi:aspartate aminotransferase